MFKEFITCAFKKSIKFFFTSNYAPEKLYYDNINSIIFEPTINYINKYANVINLDNISDFRIQNNNYNTFFHNIHNSKNMILCLMKKMNLQINNITKESLIIMGIIIDFEVIDEAIVKIDFDYLCNNNFGRDIYYALTKKFNIIYVDNFYKIQDRNILRRFIIFIDQCYENDITLIIYSNIDINDITDLQEKDFARCYSRIIEMINKINIILP